MLAHWKQQGHKALVFTQTQQMLDIMDRGVQALGYRCAPDSSCSPKSSVASMLPKFTSKAEWQHHSCALTEQAHTCHVSSPEASQEVSCVAKEHALASHEDSNIVQVPQNGRLNQRCSARKACGRLQQQ